MSDLLLVMLGDIQCIVKQELPVASIEAISLSLLLHFRKLPSPGWKEISVQTVHNSLFKVVQYLIETLVQSIA